MAGGIPQNLLANLSVRLGMDTKAFNLGTKQAKHNISGFEKSLRGVKALFTAAFGAVAIRQLKQFTDSAIEAFNVQKEAEVKLETVMRQRMQATDEMIQSVKNLTSEQQKLGIIGDEVQIAGAQQLATFLKQKDALERLIPAMNNLVAQQKGYKATGQDAVNVANMMGKVLDGQVGALRRVGISFTEAQDKMLKGGNEMERAATLAEVITDNVGEMNAELAKTDLGKIKQLQNLLGDIKEDIGEAILPIKAEVLKDFYDDVQIWTSGFATFWEKISTLFDKSGERTQRALDKIHERIEKANKWVAENKDLDKLTRMFMTKQEKQIADLAGITLDKVEADKKEVTVLTAKVPLLEKQNQLVREQLNLYAEIEKKELEKAAAEKKQLEEAKKQPVPVLMTPKGIQLARTEEAPGLVSAFPGQEFVDKWSLTAAQLETINAGIRQSFVDLTIGMTEAFALMATSSEGFQPINLLLPIANIAENLGKLAISVGMTEIALKESFKTLGGWGAVAAGVALVSLAQMVKSKVSSMASGASVSTNLPSFASAENFDRTGTRFYGQTARPEIEVTVKGEIDGEVIRLAGKRADVRHSMQS